MSPYMFIQCPACSKFEKIPRLMPGFKQTCVYCGERWEVKPCDIYDEAPPLVNQKEHEVSETGAKRENMYPVGTKFPARYDLMFRNAAGMRRLAETWGEGFKKYGADNWMNGFPASVCISHCMEHLRLYLAGDRSEDHLAHGAWNLLLLCWVEENKPELMDLSFPVQQYFTQKDQTKENPFVIKP